MALPAQQWETVRAYFERGLSLSEIVDRDDVRIKSRGSISKRAKAEGWIAGGKKQQVAREVLANQELEAVRAQKETLGAPERNVHDALVSETLRYQTFFRGANILVANAVAKKVKDEGSNASFKDLAAAAMALGRTQESVLGKSPETVINNVNAVQTVVNPTPDELRRINQALEDDC